METTGRPRKSNARRNWSPTVLSLAAYALLAAGACTESSVKPTAPRLPTGPIANVNEPFNDQGNCIAEDYAAGGGGGSITETKGCTANDIRVAKAEILEYSFDNINFNTFTGATVECDAGQPVYIRLRAFLIETATSTRTDIGVWVANDGGTARTKLPPPAGAPVGYGTCNHYNLAPAPAFTDPFTVVDGVTNVDNDQCGDMFPTAATQDSAKLELGVINTLCQGSSPTSTLVHVGSCLSWTVPGGDRVCPTSVGGPTGFRLGTLPSATSKCNCDGFDVPITIRQSAKLEIVKACTPSNDAGKFNLLIDGNTEKTDAACGGTTGSKTVGAGTSTTPGASHTFGESSGTGTSLGDYTSSFACVNRVGGSAHTATGTVTAASITLQPNEDVICTITNVRKPQVKLVKDLVPDADAGRFDLTLAGTTYDNGGNGYGDGGNTGFQNVAIGSVSLSEAAHTGTTIGNYTSALACVNASAQTVTVTSNTGTGGSISVAAGDQVTCTFTNTRKPRLRVVKATVPTSDPGKFDFTIGASTFNNSNAGYGNGEGTTFQTLSVGNVTISEAGHTGTTLSQYTSQLACVDAGQNPKTVNPNSGTSGTVALVAGDEVTCTFTNTKGASLKLVKALNPTTDGGKFDLTIGATTYTNGGAGYGHNGTTGFQPVAFGTVSFSESAHTGTSLTDYTTTLACVNAALQSVTVSPNNNTSGSVTIGAGDQITCTFTNVRKPQIKLVKDLVPDADAGRFDLTIGATTFDNSGSGYGDNGNTGFQNVAIGSVNISEAAHTGTTIGNYISALACVNASAQTVTVTNNTGVGGSISVGAGDQVTCTFQNTRKPQVKLVKDLVPDADAGRFDLTIGATTFDNSGSGYGDNGNTGFQQVSVGSVNISEAGHGTTALTDYTTTLACVKQGNVVVSVNPNNNTSGTISAAAGDMITCTFQNSRKPQVKLVKVLVPAGDAGRFDLKIGASTFDNSGGGYGNGGNTGFQNVATGSVTISELAHTGTVLTEYASSLACVNASAQSVTVTSNTGTSGSISVSAGDQVTCTFTNNHAPKLSITKTPDQNTAGYSVSPGGTAQFTITVSNASNAGPANNVMVTDTLPAGLGNWTEKAPVTGKCSFSTYMGGTENRVLDCNVGTLAAGASFTVIVQATVPNNFLVLPPTNVGLTPLDIDGDLLTNGGRDWQTINPSLVDCTTTPKKGCDLDKPTGATDDSFGQGTSEDTPVPTVVTGSIPNNKSDLLRFYVANERINITDWLYLAWERVQAPNGTTNMDFELNQSSTLSANGITRVRTKGDILIKYDLAQGGTTPLLGFHRWVTDAGAPCEKNGKKPPCWGPVKQLSAVDGVTGQINHLPADDPIDPDATRTLDSLTFGEARIDMETAGIFEPGVCVAFGSAYLKSRSSDSFPAEIKDFIAPIDIMVTNCAPVDLNNTAYARASNYAPPGGSLNDWISDTGKIHVADAGSASGLLLDSPVSRHLAVLAPSAGAATVGRMGSVEGVAMERRSWTLGAQRQTEVPWPPRAAARQIAPGVGPSVSVARTGRMLS